MLLKQLSDDQDEFTEASVEVKLEVKQITHRYFRKRFKPKIANVEALRQDVIKLREMLVAWGAIRRAELQAKQDESDLDEVLTIIDL